MKPLENRLQDYFLTCMLELCECNTPNRLLSHNYFQNHPAKRHGQFSGVSPSFSFASAMEKAIVKVIRLSNGTGRNYIGRFTITHRFK